MTATDTLSQDTESATASPKGRPKNPDRIDPTLLAHLERTIREGAVTVHDVLQIRQGYAPLNAFGRRYMHYFAVVTLDPVPGTKHLVSSPREQGLQYFKPIDGRRVACAIVTHSGPTTQTVLDPENPTREELSLTWEWCSPQLDDCPVDLLEQLSPIDPQDGNATWARRWREVIRKSDARKTIIESLVRGSEVRFTKRLVFHCDQPFDGEPDTLVLDVGEPAILVSARNGTALLRHPSRRLVALGGWRHHVDLEGSSPPTDTPADPQDTKCADDPDDSPETGQRFTVWCKESSDRGTVWIDTVEATDESAAEALAIQQCSEDWDMDPDRIRLIGMARGDVDILEWNDLSEP